MRLSLNRGCVTLWMVAHRSEWRAFTACPAASLPQTPYPSEWQRRIRGISRIGGESLFVFGPPAGSPLPPPFFFLFPPDEFKFEVNRNIFFKGAFES